MDIKNRKVEELIPYVNNPRDNSAAVDAVASSIAEFGFKVPIIVDRNNVVVTEYHLSTVRENITTSVAI